MVLVAKMAFLSMFYRGVDREVLRESYIKRLKNTEKSTKYAIRSLNNSDFSRKMAFFRQRRLTTTAYYTPPPYYCSSTAQPFSHIIFK